VAEHFDEGPKRVHHVEDPVTAPLVRQAFELYATGQYSLGTLAEELAERGLVTKPGQPFSEQMVKGRVAAGTLPYLHRHFAPPQQKLLARAVFRRIDVQEREIVGATLNPPFALFLGEQLARVFEDPPNDGTRKEVFEQLVRFTLTSEYDAAKALITAVVGDAPGESSEALAAA
jgi:hypothetical protein